jgi:hypothetical protein
MDRTGTPVQHWLLMTLHATFLLNHVAVESLQWQTRMQVSAGHEPDVSALLQFRWWEPVCCQAGGFKF